MKPGWKPFLYKKKADAALDAQFSDAISYGRVKLGRSVIFWELGFRWYAVSIARVHRVDRRVEDTLTKVGCRSAVMDIQKLILELDDGFVLELQVGEGNREETEALFLRLQAEHPELQYGKA